MYITWLGHSSFKIQTKNNGTDVTILTDPFDNKVGLRMPKVQADIVTVSHDHYDHNNIDAAKGKDTFIINEPGEYEYMGVFLYGIPSWHDKEEGNDKGQNVIFRIETEDVSVVHLGDLGQRSLTGEQMEKLEKVDVLMIPVGGKYTIDGKEAVDLINQLDPRIVIPMHYKVPGLKIDLGGVDAFCKEIGVCNAEKVKKLKVLKKELPQEEMQVVVMDI